MPPDNPSSARKSTPLSKGAAAANIIPDRNWNIADPATRELKVRKLHEYVQLCRDLDLPINVGTEMNSPGNKLVDDFSVPEIAPVRDVMLEGAHFIYGHTVGIAQGFGDFFRVFHGVDRLAFRHVNAELVHGVLEGGAVLAAFDGIDMHADDLDAVFV